MAFANHFPLKSRRKSFIVIEYPFWTEVKCVQAFTIHGISTVLKTCGTDQLEGKLVRFVSFMLWKIIVLESDLEGSSTHAPYYWPHPSPVQRLFQRSEFLWCWEVTSLSCSGSSAQLFWTLCGIGPFNPVNEVGSKRLSGFLWPSTSWTFPPCWSFSLSAQGSPVRNVCPRISQNIYCTSWRLHT